MAYIWEDDFHRANGPVGNNWTIWNGSADIYDNKLRVTTTAYTYFRHNTTLLVPDYAGEITIDGSTTFTPGNLVNVFVRNANASQYYYELRLTFPTVLVGNLQASRYLPSGSDVLARFTLFGALSGDQKLRIRVVGQTLYFYYNDVLMLAVNDLTIATGLWFGGSVYQPSGGPVYINHAGVINTDLTSLNVDPLWVLSNEPGNTLHLQGYGTNWTPGTPGSPIFTATAGTITAQTVDDITHATLTYNAPLLPQVVTIDDPDSHAGAQLQASAISLLNMYTSLFGISPADLVAIPSSIEGLGNTLAGMNATLASIVLNVVDPSGHLYLLWQMLTGTYSPAGSMPDRILDTGPDRLELIHTDTSGGLSGITETLVQLGLIRTLAYYTLGDVIDAIAAIPPPLEKPWAPVVYPGVAHITYSDLVLFDGPTTVPGPMNGAHCIITSVPPQTGSMGTGYGKMYYRIGRYSFVDDQGYHEPWEYLTFVGGNLVPSRLRQASALVIQSSPGVTGSVHPYLISP